MKDISVELSYILRHRPEKIGLSLEPGGWILVDDLLTKLKLKKDVLDLINAMEENGLKISGPVDWTVQDKVINPQFFSPYGKEYTFGILSFTKN